MPGRKEEIVEKTSKVSQREGKVTIEKSVTRNMGDGNFAKVGVSLTLSLNPTPEEIRSANKTIQVIDEIVTSKIEEQVDMMIPDEVEKPRSRRRGY